MNIVDYNFPENDRDWTESDWLSLICFIKNCGLSSYKEMASTILSALNPPQVGTAIASNKSFQRNFPKRETMKNVMAWFYNRKGCCVDCGTRLELQADHVIPKESFDKPTDADYLENLELRCRRCNVIKRPSHKNGGQTYLTASAALMWILLVKRPKKYSDFERLCREYGLTMANIRFREAWALAEWLAKEGKYDID